MGACDEHRQYKKGGCADCGICKYCKPPEGCNNKRNHFNWIREARTFSKRKEQRRGKRSSSLRGKKRTRMNEDDDKEMEPKNRDLYATMNNSAIMNNPETMNNSATMNNSSNKS